MERLCSVSEPDAMPTSAETSERMFERCDLIAEDVLSIVDCLLNRCGDFLADGRRTNF